MNISCLLTGSQQDSVLEGKSAYLNGIPEAQEISIQDQEEWKVTFGWCHAQEEC